MMILSRSSRPGNGRHRRRILHIGAIVFFIAGILVLMAPWYLIYQSGPVRSDAVIIIAGSDMEARELEARRLIRDGFARYIIIPNSGLVRRFNIGADMTSQPDQVRKVVIDLLEEEFGTEFSAGLESFEETHLEVLTARGMMSRLNLHSAIVVTYPYHLRRVKVIADRVFPENEYKLSYIYPKSIKVNSRWWFTTRNDSWWVLGEYAKIAYYLAYTHLPFLFG